VRIGALRAGAADPLEQTTALQLPGQHD